MLPIPVVVLRNWDISFYRLLKNFPIDLIKYNAYGLTTVVTDSIAGLCHYFSKLIWGII